MICAACGATAGDDARFCASCGRALRPVEDERRVVTVLFADLVGFTTLAERLDPERVKNLVDGCFERLARDVVSFGGQVDKVVGDALVALFGAPTAHEDDAERAVRAALRMQETLAEEAAAIGDDLRMRIGVNTGEVLVGAMRAAGSITAMGDVVNTASRLQTAAAPGEVLVGPATHEASARTIAYEERGPIAAKGRDQPVETWLALAPTLPPGYRARRDDIPLIGRDREVGVLRHAVEASLDNDRALLVLLVGDVGMGKSRLADEVATWAARNHDATVREGRCVPYGEANVWWPAADALRTALGVSEGDEPDVARSAVTAQVATTMGRRPGDPEVHRCTEGLMTLLGYEPPKGAEPASVRQEAGRALAAYIAAAAANRPVVFQMSDLQWADDAMLTLVDEMFASVHHLPVVVLATARPTVLDRWTPRPGRHNSLVLHLDPLDRDAAGDLLGRLVRGPVPDEIAEAVLDRSGGNPFYLEELVNLIEGDGGTAAGDDGATERAAGLPATLRGLVAARLDDLSAAQRTVLQDASVIGARGPVASLKQMLEHLGRDLDPDVTISALVDDELFEVSDGWWEFRSDLVREVAYQTITKADRAKAHLGIAVHLEQTVGRQRPRPPWLIDRVAHHYAAAVALAGDLGSSGRTASFPPDLADRARRWVVEAAERAAGDHALPAAVRLYGQAIDLLGRLDDHPVVSSGPGSGAGSSGSDGATRRAEAVRLHLAAGAAAAEAWDLRMARFHVDAAANLAVGLADEPALARSLVVRGDLEQKEGEVDLAIATLTEAADRFGVLGDGKGTGDALRRRGMVEIFAGRSDAAERSSGAAFAAYEAVGDRTGQGWATQALAWIAFTSGRLADADRHIDEAVDYFSEPVDPMGLSWSLGLMAWIRFQQRRVVEAEAIGSQVLAEARTGHDRWATAMMQVLMGSIRLWQGRTLEAVELAGQGRQTFASLGDPYGRSQADAVLGRALVMAGRVDEGFATFADAAASDVAATGPTSGQIARFTQVAAAIQVGEPDMAGPGLAELEGRGSSFGGDPQVMLAMSALQRGERERADELFEAIPTDTEDPFLGSSRALHLAATARPGAVELADRIGSIEYATYLDRTIAALAAALAVAGDGRSDGGSEARRRLAEARHAVAGTEDQVAHALVELAAAAIAAATGDPQAAEAEAAAARRLARLGIEAPGWSRIFASALGAVPA